MKLRETLNRRFGRYAIPNLTLFFIFSGMFTYGLRFIRPEFIERLILLPHKVLAGEWWRVLSLAYPPCDNPIFVLFFWYLFYLFGTALEATWGTFNFNLYLLLGYVAVVGASFLKPDDPTYNFFLYNSLFLAFAHLYPNFTLLVMFVLPVKIKWLALIDWIVMGIAMFRGDWATSIQVAASVCNFMIFFYADIFWKVRSGRWRMAQEVRKIAERDKPRHECRVCKATNITHPSLNFRYCSKCPGTPCFCEEHLKGHRHEEGAGEVAESRESEMS